MADKPVIADSLVIEEIDQIHKVVGQQPLQISVDPASFTSQGHPIKEISKTGQFTVLHGKYIYNFARKDVETQIESLVQEIEWANAIGCDVVIHQGKNIATEKMSKLEAINNYVRNLSEVIERTFDSSSMLLLENSAGQGTELGYTLDELSYIYHQFDDTVRERIGFCIDTCHIFVAGELDVRVKDEVVNFFERFNQMIGGDKLKCIHFNDSGVPFGGKHDVHGDLFGGYISNPLLGGNPDGLKAVAKMAAKLQIPLVFETPYLVRDRVPDQVNYQHMLIESWVNDVPKANLAEISQMIMKYSMDLYRPKKKVVIKRK